MLSRQFVIVVTVSVQVIGSRPFLSSLEPTSVRPTGEEWTLIEDHMCVTVPHPTVPRYNYKPKHF